MFDVETVEFNKVGAVAWVALNRPHQHNALDSQLIHELTSLFRSLSKQKDVRVIVLTGNGRSFCAGADLTSAKGIQKQTAEHLVDGELIFDLMLAVDNVPQPILGRINGAAIGGGVGLVSCCDIAVASDNAIFGFSEVRLGLVAAVISPFVISKIGVSSARELFLTGERFDGHKAVDIGLIHNLVSYDKLDEQVNERLKQLLMAAPGAQADAKRLIKRVANSPLENVRDLTEQLFSERWQSEEAQEGVRAFLEKRKPYWQE